MFTDSTGAGKPQVMRGTETGPAIDVWAGSRSAGIKRDKIYPVVIGSGK